VELSQGTEGRASNVMHKHRAKESLAGSVAPVGQARSSVGMSGELLDAARAGQGAVRIVWPDKEPVSGA